MLTGPRKTILSLHDFARAGDWHSVFTQLEMNRALVTQKDYHFSTLGWSLSDHAIYQSKVTELFLLQNKFGLWVLPHFRMLEALISTQRWSSLFELLEEKKNLDINTKFCASGLYFTLLDMVIHHGHHTFAYALRERGAKTILELGIVSELLFQAAEKGQWNNVYAILNEDKSRVDFVDKSVNKGWVLLQYAYQQRHGEAISKLVDHYSASFDELYTSDKILHDCIIDFYEASKHRGQPVPLLDHECDIIKSLSEMMIHEDEKPNALLSLSNVTPLLRPIGYERALKSAPSIKAQIPDAQYETGLHLLHKDFPGGTTSIIRSRSS
ncbi:hypothetical protein [Candidatus Berkiella aquae]|uniref:Ankyrin repeats (3 copies) n=1 Tax=Candidatus Berkiella aquae TaxID=295108 RepID=A0A0Q9YK78_9GAMM|nr:hypothetical protein [Candidatus Berkiella aquae]MCS5709994.1 hypothetical protein [Candidatus Berkiella aquae]